MCTHVQKRPEALSHGMMGNFHYFPFTSTVHIFNIEHAQLQEKTQKTVKSAALDSLVSPPSPFQVLSLCMFPPRPMSSGNFAQGLSPSWPPYHTRPQGLP